QQIRANINAVPYHNRTGDESNQSIIGPSAAFGSITCDPGTTATTADINMELVYDRLPFDNPDGGVWKQGWPLEVKPENFTGHKLKVFLVPHSHNDPGWIKTFDSYFREQTRRILTNAVHKLTEFPDMRLIWAETSYLSAWWETAE